MGTGYARYYGDIYEHTVVCERALGKPLPPGAHVHHVDGNILNNSPRNLVICENNSYHKLLHIRAEVVRLGGNPNTERVCPVCGVVLPLDQFWHRSSGRRIPGCKSCVVKRTRDWRSRNRSRGLCACGKPVAMSGQTKRCVICRQQLRKERWA